MNIDNSFVHIFRHGQTEYRQAEVELEQANDLTAEGVAEVVASVARLVQWIRKNDRVVICSSPLGRGLFTAKLIRAALWQQSGISVVNNEIISRPDLGEVANFSWQLFVPLVEGGEIEFQGEKIRVVKELTNPKNLSPEEFFFRDAILQLPSAVVESLPEAYRNQIMSFEQYWSCNRRITSFLAQAHTLNGGNDHVIIATHDCLATRFVHHFSGGQKFSLPRGDFLTIERVGHNFFVREMAGDTISKNTAPVLTLT